jgi:hypothetical protein
MGQSTFANTVTISIVFTLLLAVWTLFKKGRGTVTFMSLLIWAFGFYVGQKAIDAGFKAIAYTMQQTSLDPNSPVVFSLKESSSIYSVAVTPDGHTAVTSSTSGVNVWNIKTGRERWSQASSGQAILSPSGKLLAISGTKKNTQRTLQLYNTANGDLLATLQGEPFNSWWAIKYIMFSHNGAYLLVGSETMQLALYPVANLDSDPAAASKSGVKTLEPIIVPREIPASTYGLPPSYSHIGFNADDESIFVHAYDTLEHWTVEAQPRLVTSYRFANTVKFKPSHFSDDGKMIFDCDSSSLVLAAANSSIASEVLRIKTSLELPPGSYHIGYHCAMSPDNEWMAFGVSEHSGGTSRFLYTLNLWKTDGTPVMGDTDPEQTGKQLIPQVAQLAYSPDSHYLYVADDSLRLHIYALNNSIKVAVIPAEQIGFTGTLGRIPLIAPSNHGLLLSCHGASKAVWIPLDKTPPA